MFPLRSPGFNLEKTKNKDRAARMIGPVRQKVLFLTLPQSSYKSYTLSPFHKGLFGGIFHEGPVPFLALG